jgi:hypothetical protein
MCYAVSTSADPMGSYYRYEFVRPLFPDYPRPAVWPDGYYVPTSTGDDVIQKHACVVDRRRMLAGQPATEQCVIIDDVNFLNNADLDGTALPPPGAPNVMLATGGTQLRLDVEDDGIYAWSFHVDWDDPSRTRVDGPVKIPVALSLPVRRPAHQLRPAARDLAPPRRAGRQDHGAPRLSRIGGRESIVAVHSVNTAAGGGGVRWYEFRLGKGAPGATAPAGHLRPRLVLPLDGESRHGPRRQHRIGYSFGGTPHFRRPALRRAPGGRSRGVLTLRETVLVEGEAAQMNTLRWEDYTQTAVDPSDDCTIWYVGDYLKKGAETYSTRIGAVRVPGCAPGKSRRGRNIRPSPRSASTLFIR